VIFIALCNVQKLILLHGQSVKNIEQSMFLQINMRMKNKTPPNNHLPYPVDTTALTAHATIDDIRTHPNEIELARCVLYLLYRSAWDRFKAGGLQRNGRQNAKTTIPKTPQTCCLSHSKLATMFETMDHTIGVPSG
jgi:hypothetical protein